jgi:hypothetical protein
VRQSTWLALRRVGPGLFQVEGNVEARIESAQGMTARRADGAALAQTAVRALSLSYEDVASGKTLIQFPKP